MTFPQAKFERAAVDTLVEQDVQTLAELYTRRFELTPDAIACRWFDAAQSQWVHYDWRQLERMQRRYRALFRNAGLVPGERVALQLPNGPSWLAADWALQTLGLVTVGLYNDDTPGNTAHLLGNSGASLALLRSAESWSAARALRSFPALREVVLVQDDAALSADDGTRIRRLADALPEPTAADDAAVTVDPDALAALVYTSGSTGASRGVMLSHRALLANVFACQRAVPTTSSDRYFSVLPLTNLFERVTGAYGAVVSGAETVYARSGAQLAEDLRSQKPTVLVAVPRVYERLHAAVVAAVEQSSAPQRALFRLAVEAGWAVHQTKPGRRRLANAITRRIQTRFAERLGGRLRAAVSGGAPLAPEIAKMFVGLGLPLLQGYGLTEAGPVVSVNRLDDNDPLSAGLALDHVETRLSPEGELLVRSPSLMMGYWNDPEATAAALDDAGWLHTGDKASRLEARRVYLTGRLKEIIVTSTGRKVSPGEIEQRLLADPLIEQVMVVGEARPFLTALIVPAAGALEALRQELGLSPADDSASAREQVEALALKRCLARIRCCDVSSLLRGVALVAGPWSVANGLMTPTLKIKRNCVAKQFVGDIERLYSGHFQPARTDCSRNAGV